MKITTYICLITLAILNINNNIYANTTLNNNQYYEIEFTYQNSINGKAYTEEAVLLRDKGWLQENNIKKAGDTLTLNIPEFGVINARAIAKEVKATNLNPEEGYNNNQSMVTGTFKHYSADVREYTLKDSKTGIIQTIQATPNHAFYVQNRTAFNKALNQNSHFIEIQNITPTDKLINEVGNEVQLVCDNNICGKKIIKNNKPIAVYNLEIYKQHQYMVVSHATTLSNIYINKIAFNNAVLVHNVCAEDEAGPSYAIDNTKYIRRYLTKDTPQASDERIASMLNDVEAANVQGKKDISHSGTGLYRDFRKYIADDRFESYNTIRIREAKLKSAEVQGFSHKENLTLNEMGQKIKEVSCANCGEQAVYQKYLLGQKGYDVFAYAINPDIVDDHIVGIVFDEELNPAFVVDTWRGEPVMTYNEAVEHYLDLSGDKSVSYIFELYKSTDGYPAFLKANYRIFTNKFF
ncbi:hypothetical protein ACFX5K_00560 [Rickettsiales bacterium LUAb2]